MIQPEKNEPTNQASLQPDQKQILLVEDDIKLAELVSQYLQKNGFQIIHESNGFNALISITDLKPALIILDIMLPGLDGLSVCQQIRKSYSGPILMLTALNDEIDEVAGLEMGADGYLGKPIKPRVLLAHIRAQLRRHHLDQQTKQTKQTMDNQPSDSLIIAGQLKLDSAKRQVWLEEKIIELTSAEFDLLWLLAENKGKIIEREELHRKIFRLEYDGMDRNIDIRISKIRKKMGDDPRHSEIIKTVRGQGYILAD